MVSNEITKRNQKQNRDVDCKQKWIKEEGDGRDGKVGMGRGTLMAQQRELILSLRHVGLSQKFSSVVMVHFAKIAENLRLLN